MDDLGLRYCSATSVSQEEEYDRFVSLWWQKKVVLSKNNPPSIGSYSEGEIYLVKDQSEVIATFPGDVIVIDERESTYDDGSPKHNVKILYSARINDPDDQ